MLLPAIALIIYRIRATNKYGNFVSHSPMSLIISLSIIFIILLSLLMGLSKILTRSWDFLNKSYGFVLLVDNIGTNIGMFWYFLAEMFQSFRLFYAFVFQVHIFIYFIPILYCLPNHPVFASWVIIGIFSTFKSYPCVGDYTIFFSMFPLFNHKIWDLQWEVYVITYAILTLLFPIFYQMWIWYGSGNANFYYALTLFTCLTHSYFIADSIDGLQKRDWLIKRTQNIKSYQSNIQIK